MKKWLLIFSIVLCFLPVSLFSRSLVNVLYDDQNNKIMLYDDYTWQMGDDGWNKDESYLGRYSIKDEGLEDMVKLGLIADGTYPSTDEWIEALSMFELMKGFVSMDDILEGTNFVLEIDEDSLTFYENEYEEPSTIDRIESNSNLTGFYIDGDNIFIRYETGEEEIRFAVIVDSNRIKIDFSTFLEEDESFPDKYSKYLFITLEKE